MDPVGPSGFGEGARFFNTESNMNRRTIGMRRWKSDLRKHKHIPISITCRVCQSTVPPFRIAPNLAAALLGNSRAPQQRCKHACNVYESVGRDVRRNRAFLGKMHEIQKNDECRNLISFCKVHDILGSARQNSVFACTFLEFHSRDER